MGLAGNVTIKEKEKDDGKNCFHRTRFSRGG
jgi:hypothetical protein